MPMLKRIVLRKNKSGGFVSWILEVKMRNYLFLVTLIFSFCVGILAQEEKTWKDIVPLYSSRTEVEEKFGKAKGDCDCIYETQNETITIRYVESLCEDGWNVPKDTVLEFTVRLKFIKSIKKYNVDLSSFIEVNDDAFYSSYSNLQKGVRYYLSPYDELERIEYIPTSSNSSDNKLRCKNFPSYNPMNTVYAPFLTYEIKNWKTDISEINNLIAGFRNLTDYKLYVFVYFSKGTSEKTKTSYVSTLRMYIKKNLKHNDKSIKVVYGGARDSSKVVSFILPENLPEPTPIPKYPK